MFPVRPFLRFLQRAPAKVLLGHHLGSDLSPVLVLLVLTGLPLGVLELLHLGEGLPQVGQTLVPPLVIITQAEQSRLLVELLPL